MSIKLQNVEAILAIDSENGLAKGGQIPWKSKTDMKFFKTKTINNFVVMGSKTFFSLPNSEPLKNRTNIVITNDKEKYSKLYKNSNLFFFDLEEVLRLIKSDTKNKFFIIGGNQIYDLFLPYCSVIWLTTIKQNYNCDLKFDLNKEKLLNYKKEIIYDDDELEICCLK